MRVTSVGHAGFLIEASGASILCDPWFIPAYHGSWYPFPRNDRLPADLQAQIEVPDYLYISHQHADHLDFAWLKDHVHRSARVLLPDYATDELEQDLRSLGFTEFIHTTDGSALRLGANLDVTIHVATSVSDGPGGDSALVVFDGEQRLLNQNDCHLRQLQALVDQGPYDYHLLQFSGAIWWPMVYDFDEERLRNFAREKLAGQDDRALRYVQAINGRVVVPSAGPPAFLDEDQFGLNMIDGTEISIFPDQMHFQGLVEAQGHTSVVMLPGTTIQWSGDGLSVEHSTDPLEPFENKLEYLREYQRDWSSWLDELKSTWPSETTDLVATLQEWWEPLLATAPSLRSGVGTGCLIRTEGTDIYIDFPRGTVGAYEGQPIGYRFTIPRPLLETVIRDRCVDWSNSLFLSCRFKAWRKGDYNEYVYAFFKSLSPERMARAEAEAQRTAKGTTSSDKVTLGEHTVERWCPHRQADLGEFGEVEGDEIVCTMHGWRFNAKSGECVNATCRPLTVY